MKQIVTVHILEIDAETMYEKDKAFVQIKFTSKNKNKICKLWIYATLAKLSDTSAFFVYRNRDKQEVGIWIKPDDILKISKKCPFVPNTRRLVQGYFYPASIVFRNENAKT